MDKQTEALQSVLKEMMRRTGLKPSPLAVRAGLAASTVTRFVSEDGGVKDPSWSISASTLIKLCAFSGVAVIFGRDGVNVIPEGRCEFTQNADEIRLLMAWRALSDAERDTVKRQLNGLLSADQNDNVIQIAR